MTTKKHPLLFLRLLVWLAVLASSILEAKIILVGDSTLANDYGQVSGWGKPLQSELAKQGVNVDVENAAVPGSNSHTWTNQGLFDKVGAKVSSGDTVLIQMGTNEQGDIQNFDGLVGAAVKEYKAKGAKVILASMVPHNPFSGGTEGGAYTSEMAKVAQQTGAEYIDVNSAAYKAMKTSGSPSMYTDTLHTTAAGAQLIASAAAPLIKEKLGGGGGGGSGANNKAPTTPTMPTTPTTAGGGGGNATGKPFT